LSSPGVFVPVRGRGIRGRGVAPECGGKWAEFVQQHGHLAVIRWVRSAPRGVGEVV